MTEPAIKLSNSVDMTKVFLDSTKMTYLLYADDYYLENWFDWVRDSSNKPNANAKLNAANYSNYVLKIRCELAQQNNACGFLSGSNGAVMIASDSSTGEIVAAANDAATIVSNTYVMKKAEWDTWLTTFPIFSGTTFGTANTSVNDPYFQFFYCGGSRDHIYTCYKYQPTDSSDGNPRFDTDSTGVKGVYYTSGVTPELKAVTLTGALMGASTAALALTAGIVSMAF